MPPKTHNQAAPHNTSAKTRRHHSRDCGADQTLIPKQRLIQTLRETGLVVKEVREDYNIVTITALKT